MVYVSRGLLPRYGQCELRIAVLIVGEVVADVAARVREEGDVILRVEICRKQSVMV